ncbi:hypothetical protein [Beduini massiliensis]|nr:hypothetical protein [Beduini massiliensis]
MENDIFYDKEYQQYFSDMDVKDVVTTVDLVFKESVNDLIEIEKWLYDL